MNGKMEADGGRMAWELLVRPSLEHATEGWLTGRQTAHKKLESVQMRVEKSLLGASNTVAGVLGDKVEEIGEEEGGEEGPVW